MYLWYHQLLGTALHDGTVRELDIPSRSVTGDHERFTSNPHQIDHKSAKNGDITMVRARLSVATKL